MQGMRLFAEARRVGPLSQRSIPAYRYRGRSTMSERVACLSCPCMCQGGDSVAERHFGCLQIDALVLFYAVHKLPKPIEA